MLRISSKCSHTACMLRVFADSRLARNPDPNFEMGAMRYRNRLLDPFLKRTSRLEFQVPCPDHSDRGQGVCIFIWAKKPMNEKAGLKNWILVSDQGGEAFKAAGIQMYFEDLKRRSNADMEPKDFFESAFRYRWRQQWQWRYSAHSVPRPLWWGLPPSRDRSAAYPNSAPAPFPGPQAFAPLPGSYP